MTPWVLKGTAEPIVYQVLGIFCPTKAEEMIDFPAYTNTNHVM